MERSLLQMGNRMPVATARSTTEECGHNTMDHAGRLAGKGNSTSLPMASANITFLSQRFSLQCPLATAHAGPLQGLEDRHARLGAGPLAYG
jgi:hypothetical protein